MNFKKLSLAFAILLVSQSAFSGGSASTPKSVTPIAELQKTVAASEEAVKTLEAELKATPNNKDTTEKLNAAKVKLEADKAALEAAMKDAKPGMLAQTGQFISGTAGCVVAVTGWYLAKTADLLAKEEWLKESFFGSRFTNRNAIQFVGAVAAVGAAYGAYKYATSESTDEDEDDFA